MEETRTVQKMIDHILAMAQELPPDVLEILIEYVDALVKQAAE